MEIIETKPLDESEWPRIVLHIPMERVVQTPAFYGFWEIARQGWPLIKTGYTRCDVGRNRAAIALLKSRYTHVLMMDSDHIHPPDLVYRLARWVKQDPERLVVGGLNFRRGKPFDPCAYYRNENGDLCPLVKWGQGLFAVEVLGSGCILISRKVFETVPAPWFGYTYNRIIDLDWPYSGQTIEEFAAGVGWPGTDIWFSQRMKEAGIDQWVDPTTTSPHIYETTVGESTWRSYLAEHKDELTEHEIRLKGGRQWDGERNESSEPDTSPEDRRD